MPISLRLTPPSLFPLPLPPHLVGELHTGFDHQQQLLLAKFRFVCVCVCVRARESEGAPERKSIRDADAARACTQKDSAQTRLNLSLVYKCDATQKGGGVRERGAGGGGGQLKREERGRSETQLSYITRVREYDTRTEYDTRLMLAAAFSYATEMKKWHGLAAWMVDSMQSLHWTELIGKGGVCQPPLAPKKKTLSLAWQCFKLQRAPPLTTPQGRPCPAAQKTPS